MKRRSILQSLVAIPALAGSGAAQTGGTAPAIPKLDVTSADLAAEPVQRFFTADQAASLQRLAELLMPGGGGNPSALEAGAPAFLDFLLAHSPASAQATYRQGLDRLQQDSQARYRSAFAQLSDAQAATLLEPLRQAATYEPAAETRVNFLFTLRQDLLTATRNSREWLQAPTRGRSSSGLGMYWHPLE